MITLAAAALCGCGGTRLIPDTPPGVDLSGSWMLDAKASQNPQPMLDQIREAQMKRLRRAGPPRDPLDPTDPADDGPERGESTGGPIQTSGRHAGAPPGAGASAARTRFFARRLSYETALGPQLHVDRLTIEQTPTRMVFSRGEWRRTFTPGGQSVVSVADGVADQRSGWSGRDYVIELKPQVGARVIERYGLSADNRQLVERFTLTDEGLPKLEFTRVYVRGTPPPRALPTSN
ncbi:MAG TPA: hypothetical protein VGE96_01330 [Steroidobacteraceae bacterium]|jgi:hypothetical protein